MKTIAALALALALAACAEPALPNLVEVEPDPLADAVADRSWELLGGPGNRPEVTWVRDCMWVVDHDGETKCVRGLYRVDLDHVWAQENTREDEGVWQTSLTHELTHARIYYLTGDGDRAHESAEFGMPVWCINMQLRLEFYGNELPPQWTKECL